MKMKAPTKEEILQGKLASLLKHTAALLHQYCEGKNDDAPAQVADIILAKLPELILPYELKIIKKQNNK